VFEELSDMLDHPLQGIMLTHGSSLPRCGLTV